MSPLEVALVAGLAVAALAAGVLVWLLSRSQSRVDALSAREKRLGAALLELGPAIRKAGGRPRQPTPVQLPEPEEIGAVDAYIEEVERQKKERERWLKWQSSDLPEETR
ncbi:MAG: hypothetical protein AAGJ19_13715 [Myxococcota bacterium]